MFNKKYLLLMIGIFSILTILSNCVNAEDYGYNNYLDNLEDEESTTTSNGTSGSGWSNSTYNETYATWLPNYTAFHDIWYNHTFAVETLYGKWFINETLASMSYTNLVNNSLASWVTTNFATIAGLNTASQNLQANISDVNSSLDTKINNLPASNASWNASAEVDPRFTAENASLWLEARNKFNATYAQYAYNMSDGSYNATYNQWAYNMTTLGDYNYNESTWLISEYGKWWYNFTLADVWMYNMTDGSYNATYAIWAYNQSLSEWHYNMSDGTGGSYNASYATWDRVLNWSDNGFGNMGCIGSDYLNYFTRDGTAVCLSLPAPENYYWDIKIDGNKSTVTKATELRFYTDGFIYTVPNAVRNYSWFLNMTKLRDNLSDLSVGSFNTSYNNHINNWTLHNQTLVYNHTQSANKSIVETYDAKWSSTSNASYAISGNCSGGALVQNITSSGVQCRTPTASGMDYTNVAMTNKTQVTFQQNVSIGGNLSISQGNLLTIGATNMSYNGTCFILKGRTSTLQIC